MRISTSDVLTGTTWAADTHLAGAGPGEADAAGPHAAQHATRAAVVGRHDDWALHKREGRVSCLQQRDQTLMN